MAEPSDSPVTAVAAVVLAAGRGERMGGRKLELPWGDTTVLGAVLRAVAEAGVGQRVVVLGHEPERLRPIVAAAGAASVLNPRFDSGMLSSVQCGIEAIGAAVEGVLIVPGDQPRISAATMRAVLEARQPGDGLVLPTHDGRRGHPLWIAADLVPEVATLDPSRGLRQLRERHLERVRYVPVADSGVLIDLDTPADYAAHRPSSSAE